MTQITNHQITITKETPIPKHQAPNGLGIGSLELGACLVFGIWSLVIAAPMARAEDMTVETYYPSPRGVYQELRTTDNTALATLAGNVGIGTTSVISPGTKLDVRGRVHMQIPVSTTKTGGVDTSYGVSISDEVDSTLAIRSLGSGVMHVATDEAGRALRLGGGLFEETLTLQSGGRVGIGTTGPVAKLYVASGGSAAAFFLDGDAGAALIHNEGGGYSFRVNDQSSDPTPFLIDASGNVGIGVTVPAGKLQVGRANPTVADAGGLVLGSGTGGGGARQYWIGAADPANTNNNMFVIGDYGFENTASFTPYLTILGQHAGPGGAGNVGIGTTNPAAKLHVIGNMIVDRPGGGSWLRLNGTGGTVEMFNTDNGGLYIQNGSGGFMAGPLTIAANVGIGTTGPAEPLDVSGNIRASGSIYTPSDARFKTNIQSLGGALEKIEKIRAVSFERSELGQSAGQPGDRRELGILAQELEQEFPELVKVYGAEGYRSVDYSRLTVVLLQAIKELQEKTEVLTGKVETLRQDNAILQRGLAALKKSTH